MKATTIGIWCAGLLATAIAATSLAQDLPPITHDCDYVDPERPYVCDVGPPRPMSMQSFREVMTNDGAVRALVRRIGMPYAVEMQRVRVEDPWYTWEVRAYYPNYDRMYAFGRAFILGVPEVSLMRFEGKIPRNRWHTNVVTTTTMVGSDADSAAARAEAAAEQAEMLADHADRLANRADAIADQAGQEFKSSLYKH
jgi:hypothetical protein